MIGAGIGGLSAAHRLQHLAASRGCPLEIVVLDGAARPGGVLGTETHQGVVLEQGPDTFVTHKPAALALCEQLGLCPRLIFPSAGHTDILHNGRLIAVPPGFALLAPSRLGPLLWSPLFSWRGKLRLLREPSVAPRTCRPQSPDRERTAAELTDDESVAAFARRRFGTELVARLTEPIVGGIYMADVEQLSLAATFPRFLALEREQGSLTQPWWRPSSTRPPAPNRGVASVPARVAPPPVAGLAGGLAQIVEALLARLPPESLRLATRVERLSRARAGFSLELANRAPLPADAVLLATPGHAAARLLHDFEPTLAAKLGEIAYASCATVNLSWPLHAVRRPPHSHGFFVPRSAGLPLVAAGFVNVKFPDRVPAGQMVVRVFFGGALHPEAIERTDAELSELARAALAPLLGLRAAPSWSRVFRHRLAMPQLAVGHLALVADLRARLKAHPGLECSGGPVGAYGLPDSIAAGEAAAERLFEWLNSGG